MIDQMMIQSSSLVPSFEKEDYPFGKEDDDVEDEMEEGCGKSLNSKGVSIETNRQRVIAHIDLDCFYVQVERYHNPYLKDKPVAVVQHNPLGDLRSYATTDNRFKDSGMIIAVSYEARARGVKRIMRGAEAKKVCPELLLIQVPTAFGKPNLQIYMEASTKMIKVLGSRFPSITIERASIDEVYLDVTTEAIKYLERFPEPEVFLSKSVEILRTAPTLIAGEDIDEIKFSKSIIRDGHTGTMLNNYVSDGANNERIEKDGAGVDWFSRPFKEWTIEDRLLIAGARIIQQLRKDVFDQLGFTCSAGIAENKMLSKLASGMHKPNKQTIVPKVFVADMMINLPFSRVQGFGGKLGEDIIKSFENKVTTMGDLLALPRPQLIHLCGPRLTDYALMRAKGIDNDPVQDRSLPLQISCSKAFRPSEILLNSNFLDGTLFFWLKELGNEFIHRITVDREDNQRIPTQLHVGFTVKVVDGKTNHRKSGENELTGINADPQAKKTRSSFMDNRRDTWSEEEEGVSISKSIKIQTSKLSVDSISQMAANVIQRSISENPRIQQLLTKVLQFTRDQNNVKNEMSKNCALKSLGFSACQFEKIPQGKNAITSFLVKAIANVPFDGETEFIRSSLQEKDSEDGKIADFQPTSEELNEVMIVDENLKVDHNRDGGGDSNHKRKFSSLHSSEEKQSMKITELFQSKEKDSLPLKKLQSFYEKYLKNSTSSSIDWETFLSFPEDIQQELMNQVLFEKNFVASHHSMNPTTPQRKTPLGNYLKNNSKTNGIIDHHHHHNTKSLNEWFTIKKKLKKK